MKHFFKVAQKTLTDVEDLATMGVNTGMKALKLQQMKEDQDVARVSKEKY